MGLDVSLYRYADFEAATALEAQGESASSEVWAAIEPYDSATAEQKAAARADIASRYAALGLNKYGSADEPLRTEINIDSEKYPEHLFKIGYLRSSYNSGGFNSVAKQIAGLDLYFVFEPGDDYHVRPDWSAARERAQRLLGSLQEATPYRVETVGHNVFSGLSKVDAESAMADFRKRAGEEHTFGGHFSCKEGSFFLDKPLQVFAALPGVDVLGGPAVHLIYKQDDEARDWYIQAAEITLEMIEYVLRQDDPASYVLHWSS